MAKLLNEQTIQFPPGLMNTARSPNVLKNKHARYLENMRPANDREAAGEKRFGTVTKGDAIGAGTIAEVMEYRKTDGTLETLAYTNNGKIHRLNADDTWTELKSGLRTDGLVRWESFNNKLVVVNGIDSNMAYDGSSFTDLQEEVEEGATIAWVSTTQFTVSTGVDLTGAGERYDNAGGATIRAVWNSGANEATGTISAASYSAPLITVTLSSAVLPGSDPGDLQIYYTDKPQPFSDIFAHQDRLWALGGGTTKADTFRGTDGLTLYHTDRPNNENAWFNATTQAVPFINCRNKHRGFDEFVRIKQIDGLLVLFGRSAMQIWLMGTDPTATGGAVWQKTIPVGCINGNLVQEFPRDLFFFTEYGARSIRTVFQTEDLEVTTDLGTNIDPDLTAAISNMRASDANYRAARSFFYSRDGFYGFKVFENCYTYFLSERSSGWCIWTGHFKSADAYIGTRDGHLLIARGDQLYQYANGSAPSIDQAFSDAGSAIRTVWWTGWYRFPGQRWSNRYWRLLLENSAAMAVSLRRYINSNENDGRTVDFSVDATPPFWDEAFWDEEDWTIGDKEPRVRDKFLAESYSFVVETNTTTGPFVILGVVVEGK